ncbi:MAG: hypothetical protein AB1390_08325 [Nitrospirota bacterium]
MISEMDFFEDILRELDRLRQYCEDMEDRLRWIEEAMRLTTKGARIEVPQWYKSWLSGKIDA